MKPALLLFVMLLFTALPARADTLDDAQAAYLKGEFTVAAKLALQYLELDLHFPPAALGTPTVVPGENREQAIAEYWISFAMSVSPMGGSPHAPLAGLGPTYWSTWDRTDPKDLTPDELSVLNRTRSGSAVMEASAVGSKRCQAVTVPATGEKEYYCAQLLALPPAAPQAPKPAYTAPTAKGK